MRAAIWLLTRVRVDESLIGDLIEQRRAGRSRDWIWFQAIAAVLGVVLRDVTRHPARALLTVVLGLVLRDLHKALWSVVWHYTNPAVARLLPLGFMPVGVTLSWTNMLMAVPGWIVIGWLVARVSGPTLVLPYVVVSGMLVAPDLWRQTSNALEDVRFRPYLYIAIARETMFAMSVIAGALFARRLLPIAER